MKIAFSIIVLAVLSGGLFWVLKTRQQEVSVQKINVQGIAFFNAQVVWESVPSFQKPKKELEAILTKLQKDYAAIDTELREESRALQERRMILQEREKKPHTTSKKEHEKMAKDLDSRWVAFDKKVLNIQKTVEAKKLCIGDAYEKANKALHGFLAEKVKAIAEKKGLTMILSKEVVVFAEPHLDLTQDIISELKDGNPEICLDLKKCV
jgi:Skp family chaperone for outer membrane proteins